MLVALASVCVLGCDTGSRANEEEIVFTRSEAGIRKTQLFVVGLTGQGERQLTNAPAAPRGGQWSDRSPQWSPAGSSILFTRCAYSSALCENWVIQREGAELVRLGPACRDPWLCEDRRDAVWSPSGKLVAFSRNWGLPGRDSPQFSDLYVIDRNGRHLRRLTRFSKGSPYSGKTSEPAWSPDGRKVAFIRRSARGSAIFVLDENGQGVRRITPWQLGASGPIHWSPNGRWIVFEANDYTTDNSGLYVVHPDGTGFHRASALAFSSDPSFSPDSRWILFVAETSSHFTPQIYVVHPEGSELRRLSDFAEGTLARSPSFSPDGERIVFSEGDNFSKPDPAKGHGDIFVMRLDGTDIRAITSTGGATEDDPDWSPR